LSLSSPRQNRSGAAAWLTSHRESRQQRAALHAQLTRAGVFRQLDEVPGLAHNCPDDFEKKVLSPIALVRRRRLRSRSR